MSLHDERPPMPNELIEAMAVALSMADPDERGLPEGKEMAPFYRELATAAYAALREKLVPVGWIKPDWQNPENYDGLSPISTFRLPGWLPLYHLPEIKDAD